MFGLIPFRMIRGNNTTISSLTDLFDNFFNDDFTAAFNGSNDIKAAVRETNEAYLVEAELSGVNKEDLRLDYENNYLTISAMKNETFEDRQDNYLRQAFIASHPISIIASNVAAPNRIATTPTANTPNTVKANQLVLTTAIKANIPRNTRMTPATLAPTFSSTFTPRRKPESTIIPTTANNFPNNLNINITAISFTVSHTEENLH